MSIDDAVRQFLGLEEEHRLLVLARVSFDLTRLARSTYVPGTDDVADPQRLRILNEIQHRVSGNVLARLRNDPNRYPDDVLARIIMGDNDPVWGERMLTVFERAMSRVRADRTK